MTLNELDLPQIRLWLKNLETSEKIDILIPMKSHVHINPTVKIMHCRHNYFQFQRQIYRLEILSSSDLT